MKIDGDFEQSVAIAEIAIERPTIRMAVEWRAPLFNQMAWPSRAAIAMPATASNEPFSAGKGWADGMESVEDCLM